MLAGELLLDHFVELVQRRGLDAVERRDAHHQVGAQRTPGSWPALRPPGRHRGTTSTMAMICGCSWRISSATARASIHLSASRPLLRAAEQMRSMTLAALSSPSALISTLRRYSSTPTPSEVWLSTVEVKSLEHLAHFVARHVLQLRSSRRRCAARPWRPCACITSAASCSPSDSSRIAARSMPLRFGFCGVLLTHRRPPTSSRPARTRAGSCVTRRARLRDLSVRSRAAGAVRLAARRRPARRPAIAAWRALRTRRARR